MTYTEPGRGRKHCPGCHLYVGVATAQCGCGHQFTRSPTNSPAPTSSTIMTVVAPAGACPIKLTEFDVDGIVEWGQRIIEWGTAHNMKFGWEALIQYARQFVDINSPEFVPVRQAILDEFGG
jgi:hypothetical protein